MIPDGEAVLSDYLRDSLDDIPVVDETPDDRRDPWVRITQLDAPEDPVTGVDHLVEFWFQVECCSGTEGEPQETHGRATDLARDVRAALEEIARAEHDGAVVTAKEVTGDARLPDEDFEPAMPRRVLTVSVWMHSHPAGS